MTIHLKAKIGENGKLTIDDLPLPPGQEVALTIVAAERAPASENRYPLKGSAYRYDDPFAPAVAPDEWEANG